MSSLQTQAHAAHSAVEESTVLATASEIGSGEQPWIVSIGRVTLARGAALASHPVNGVEMSVVESGELRTQVGECSSRCIATVTGISRFVSGETLLQPGDGFSAAEGTIAYEPGASGSVTFLMIAIAQPNAAKTAGTPTVDR